MKIRAYLKPHCGWSKGVQAIFEKYGLEYELVNIYNSAENYQEMVELSGQQLSPCIMINEQMLADVSGDEVEAYMLEHELVKPTHKNASFATDKGCEALTPEQTQAETIRFF